MHSGGTSMALRRAEICATVVRMAQSRRSADQTPDLFDAAPSRGEQPQARSYSPAKTPYILPADLPSALRRLSDADLRQLTDAVTAELQRRNPPVTTPPPSSARDSASSFPKIKKTLPDSRVPNLGPAAITTAKLNAIRAALGAGVKPTVLARQFGVSQSVIREALAQPKRK